MASNAQFEIVVEASEIRRLSRLLKAELWKNSLLYPKRTIGSRGGSAPRDLRYRDDYKFWFYWSEEDEGHAWIPFGLGAPELRANSMLAQINFLWHGDAKNVGGAFGRRGSKYYFLSRGRLAGGTEGVGKNAFWDSAKGLVVGELHDSSRLVNSATEPVFVLGEVGRNEIVRNLVTYLGEVKRFKDKVRGRKSEDVRDLAAETEQTLVAANFASITAVEGHPTLVEHLKRERDPRLRRLALKELLKKGPAACLACGNIFDQIYGAAIGKGLGVVFHHMLPLSAGLRKSKVSDLAPLCPNCHWAVHSRRPEPLSIRELKRALLLADSRRKG